MNKSCVTETPRYEDTFKDMNKESHFCMKNNKMWLTLKKMTTLKDFAKMLTLQWFI